jgi:3-oxoacyl-[acyl-carrier-protein] synthase II
MIRDGDVDFAVVGGIDMPIVPEIVVGFANMNAAIKLRPGDRAYDQPGLASRPFSLDRKGFVLAEGAAALVLAADEAVRAHGLEPRAEVLGIGWNSDAHHFTRLNPPTVARAMREALEDAELLPNDVACVNAHGTSTGVGDAVEAACLKQVFGERIERLPITANKSMLGHSLGGAAAIEAVLAIEGMRRGIILPTANYLPDPELGYLNIVSEEPRRQAHELTLSNAFGFGGTNCCVVLRGL